MPQNRGACCHVAGDIDFDTRNNLWLVTGDDTPAGGGNSGGFGPFNDMINNAGLFNAPHVDARRGSQNTNDLRGKILRIKVKDGDIAPIEANSLNGAYTVPPGNLFAPGTEKTRPEVYAMGFRNPFRLQVDENDVAYITDYSPDSNTPTVNRGPAGTGRMMVVRQPANYGWPLCYRTDLAYFRWNFNTSQPLDNPPQKHECDNPNGGRRTTRAGTSAAGRRSSRASSTARRSPTRRCGTRSRPRTGRDPDRDAVLGVLRRDAAGRGAGLPAAVPGARDGRRRARTARRSTGSTRTTRTRRSSRPTTTARSSSASSRATRCARSGSTRRAACSRSTSS